MTACEEGHLSIVKLLVPENCYVNSSKVSTISMYSISLQKRFAHRYSGIDERRQSSPYTSLPFMVTVPLLNISLIPVQLMLTKRPT